MRAVQTDAAPEPLGHYSQGVSAGGFVFVSMQLPIDPQNPDKLKGGIMEQTRQVLSSVIEVAKAGGARVSSIAKVTIFLKDPALVKDVNTVYADVFEEEKPARSVCYVTDIPKGYDIAVEAIAFVKPEGTP